MSRIAELIEEYKALRNEIGAMPESTWRSRKLELINKGEEVYAAIKASLLPCPICGSSHISVVDDFPSDGGCIHLRTRVTCDDCKLTLPTTPPSEFVLERLYYAANKWNKRPD